MEQYSDRWRNSKVGECISTARNISHELQEYRKELESDEVRQLSAEEERRYNKLYSILKKILDTASISTIVLPNLPFREFRDEKTDYDRVINILDRVKNDANKLAEVWKILFRIFLEGEDIPTDEIEKMEHIAGIAV